MDRSLDCRDERVHGFFQLLDALDNIWYLYHVVLYVGREIDPAGSLVLDRIILSLVRSRYSKTGTWSSSSSSSEWAQVRFYDHVARFQKIV